MRRKSDVGVRTAENILNHELIGLKGKVVKSINPYNVGVKGNVIDETMHTLVFGNGERRTIVKKGSIFKFDLQGGTVFIEGDMLDCRPEDRVKKSIRRRW
jgi:ribonuclease P protein subunit POP4